MTKMLIFDMDGTIADFYSVENWLSMVENEDSTPYEVAEPMVDMEKLKIQLTTLSALGWTIAVTSWLSMNSTQDFKAKTRQAKREWLATMNLPIDEMHLVQYGTPKQKCTKGDIQILIDDNLKVRDDFENLSKGRYAINPQEIDILDFLTSLIELEKIF